MQQYDNNREYLANSKSESAEILELCRVVLCMFGAMHFKSESTDFVINMLVLCIVLFCVPFSDHKHLVSRYTRNGAKRVFRLSSVWNP